MKRPFIALLLPALLPCLVCHGQKLTDITSSNFNGATTIFNGEQLVVENMRAASKTTTPADYIRGTFQFSNSTENFTSTKFTVFQDVGVFNAVGFDNFFAKNSTDAIVLVNKNGNKFVEDKSYTVSTGSTPYTTTLHVGQVLSFLVSDFSAETSLKITAPDGSLVFEDYFVGTDSGFITGGLPIFLDGKYTITFAPVIGKTATKFTMGFGNANRTKLTTVKDGSELETNLREDLRDYAKYEVHLEAGDQLSMDAPSSNQTRMAVMSPQSAFLVDNVGVAPLLIATREDNYYIFICDSFGYGENYEGAVHVTKLTSAEVLDAVMNEEVRFNSHSTPARPRE